MNLNDFNNNKINAVALLLSCCGSAKWVSLMETAFPFADEKDLVKKAEALWYNTCKEKDWLEAFAHHPKIGDSKSLAEKFAGDEQASVRTATPIGIAALADANKLYEEKFGFIFIVCASGKSTEEMLRLLNDRLDNSHEEEIKIAMGEQHKITLIRMKKILNGTDWSWLPASQLTTHVLDTSLGKPGKDISIRLKSFAAGNWQTMAQGLADKDGRVSDLLPPAKILIPGNYKIVFDTGKYFSAMNLKGFYPEADIQFSITDESHYHIPLLINPFGYSTYRGS